MYNQEEDESEGPYISKPTLSLEEVWARNAIYKNWGAYDVIIFVKGEPMFLITAVRQLLGLGVIIIATSWKIYRKENLELVYQILYWVFALATVTSILLFQMRDPGISSDCLPVGNQDFLRGDNRYCKLCRIYKDKSKGIKHCQICNTCIRQSLGHTKILERCITPKNIGIWLVLIINTLTYLGLSNFIIWFL